ELEGYADSVGSADYNVRLSQRRVETVHRYLARAGVPLERISPEARAAMAAFDDARDDLQEWLFASASGRELAAWGWRDDVETAAALDVDGAAPVLTGPAFVAAGRPRGHLVRQ
ncbi:MAG TPA: OmpA family protein, partial [Acidimicrobiales bacterium]|nr:OmpA family protein [Acidimicrobiales bacterium]